MRKKCLSLLVSLRVMFRFSLRSSFFVSFHVALRWRLVVIVSEAPAPVNPQQAAGELEGKNGTIAKLTDDLQAARGEQDSRGGRIDELEKELERADINTIG